jgi:hypothetical protein
VLGEDEKRRQEDGFGPHGEEMAKLSKRCDQVVSPYPRILTTKIEGLQLFL